MSARDEQPVTVPPPAGEDDAYSATTKVGAMPADIMEKLRAEGLLPEDAQERATDVPSVPRPSTSLDRRPTPVAPPPDDGGPVPMLYSTAPPASHPSTKPTGPPLPLDSVETPVAFTAPAVDPASPLVSAPPPRLPRDEDEEDEEERRAETTGLTRQKAGDLTKPPPAVAVEKKPSPMMMVLVGVVVVILLIVALLRLSR